MKKTVILFAILFAFIASETCIAGSFKAKAGYDAALAKATSSLTNPEFLLVGTGNGNTGALPISPEFNFDTGEAMIWFYIFQESDQSSYKAYIVVEIPIIGFQVTEIPFDQIIPMLPMQPKGKVESDAWVDSDVMITTFKQESKVQEYLNTYPVPSMYFIGMFTIAENQIVPDNNTYWSLILKDEQLPLSCAMDAYTKEVWCGVQLGDIIGFTAKQAYPSAKQRAVDDGLVNPEALMVITMKTGIESIPISNKFDFEKGTANYWIYHFREKDNPGKMSAYVAWNDKISGYTMQQMDVSMVMDLMPVSPIAPLKSENWPDSDYMVNIFNQHDYFNIYMDEHPDPWSYIIGIFVSEDNPQLEPLQAYWAVVIVDDEITHDSLACVMNIDNDEITCGTLFSSVDDVTLDNISLYPNPANESILINLPESDFHSTSIILYDIIGNVAISNNDISDYSVRLDVSKLSAGVYILKVNTGAKTFVRKVIIER